MTNEEAMAIGRKLFEAFDSVLEALDSGNNSSCSSCEKVDYEPVREKFLKACEKKNSEPVGEELLKANDSQTSKKTCLGCAFLGTKPWKNPCVSCRRNCKAFFEDACDGCCYAGLAKHCHEKACIKLCNDNWKEKI